MAFLTYRNVKDSLAVLGVSLRKLSDTGEFRVNRFGAKEEAAYYTDDLEDAYFTGARMGHRQAA